MVNSLWVFVKQVDIDRSPGNYQYDSGHDLHGLNGLARSHSALYDFGHKGVKPPSSLGKHGFYLTGLGNAFHY